MGSTGLFLLQAPAPKARAPASTMRGALDMRGSIPEACRVLLSLAEKLMMNNPVRAALQRHYEARRLLAMGGRMRGGKALEIGCGRGVGARIVLERFGAEHVDAFDLDADMVDRAREHLRDVSDRVRLWVGDATEIAAEDDSYDAVFDFGIIHHVPTWRRAVAEVHRVLRPGGRLYAEEVLARFIHHPIWRRVLEHPMHDRFDAPTFALALTRSGFEVRGTRELWGQFAWFVADKPA
jgi:ubiquinone/menaquinone biosynthesis C-methylase UbiE